MNNAIILIEDDPIQSETIKTTLEKCFRDTEVMLVETEADFRAKLSDLVRDRNLKAVISDVMLPWSFPFPDAPAPPKDVVKGTYRQAGTRCHDWFRKQFEDVLWVYFTILDENTINFKRHSNQFTRYAQKSSSLDQLIAQIEEFYRIDQSWNESSGRLSRWLESSSPILAKIKSALGTSWNECFPELV